MDCVQGPAQYKEFRNMSDPKMKPSYITVNRGTGLRLCRSLLHFAALYFIPIDPELITDMYSPFYVLIRCPNQDV